jgi:putative inorganic carbon (hco3(-)) transporter
MTGTTLPTAFPRRVPLSETRPFFRSRERAVAGGDPLSYRVTLFFLLLLYANVALWIPALEVVRPAQITVIVATLLLVFEGMTGRLRLGLVWPESPLLLAFLMAAYLSTFTALWPRAALETSVELTKCAVVYFLVALTADTIPRLRKLMWTLVLGGFFPAVGTLVFYAQGKLHEGRSSWLGIFENPNDAAYGLVILLPIAFALGSLSGLRGKLLAALALLTYSAAIYTTFSRGGLLGFFAVLVVVGMRVRSQVMRTAAVGLLLLAFVAVGYFWRRADGFESLGVDTTLDQRMITMKAGLEMFMDHPLLGVGAGCSVIGFVTYAPAAGYLTHKALMVHNTFVQALAEVGLLGGVPFLMLLCGALFGAHRLARRRPDVDPALPVLAAAIQASLVGLIVCGMAGGYVLSWFPYILCGLVSAARRAAAAPVRAALSEAA